MKDNSNLVALLSGTQGETVIFGDYGVGKIIGIGQSPSTI